MAKKIQRGDRVVFDYYNLHTPMLDEKGEPRSSWKGPLMKFGYKKVHATVNGLAHKTDDIIVRIDGWAFDTKLRPSEPKGACAHTHINLKHETEKDIAERDAVPCSKELDLEWYYSSI
jgi:hypothetical protein